MGSQRVGRNLVTEQQQTETHEQKTTDPARKEPASVPRTDLGEPPREAEGNQVSPTKDRDAGSRLFRSSLHQGNTCAGGHLFGILPLAYKHRAEALSANRPAAALGPTPGQEANRRIRLPPPPVGLVAAGRGCCADQHTAVFLLQWKGPGVHVGATPEHTGLVTRGEHAAGPHWTSPTYGNF